MFKKRLQTLPKSTLALGVLATLLSLWAIYIIYNDYLAQDATFGKHFLIHNIEHIHTITIENGSDKAVVLKKTENNWKVNNLYDLDNQILSLIYEIVTKTEVKRPLFQEDKDYLKVASNKKVIELHIMADKNEYQWKIIENPNETGTFYLITPDNNEPMFCYLPGYENDIFKQLTPNPIDYKNKVIFSFMPYEIERLEVNFYNNASPSYTIINESSKFRMADNTPADSLRLYSYMQLYEYADVKKWISHNTPWADSLKKLNPAFGISIHTKTSKKSIEIYYEPNQKTPVMGRIIPDSMYAVINTKVFEYLLQKKDFFIKK